MSGKEGVVLPILIMGLGIAWLLNTIGVVPGVDWIWTGGLGICGILVLAASGLNKLSVVIGPLLLIGSVLSILRQTGRLELNIEMPVLFIVFGALLALAHLAPLPLPAFLRDDAGPKK